MGLVTLKKILANAQAGKYAVGAFNVFNINFAEAVFEASIESKSPIIINMAEVHFPFWEHPSIISYIHSRAEEHPFDVCLNLDHGLSVQTIKQSIDKGFTGMMFDGSALPLEENIKKSREVVDICRAKGISVESELGAVGGSEGGELIGSIDPLKYTNPSQAKEFVEQTGIDALAVAIGNSHGKYKGEPDLDFDRLRQLRDTVDVPLVLHGGSGISDDDFKRAISLGICKINFFTGMAQLAQSTTSDFLSRDQVNYNDYPEMMRQVRMAVKRVVVERMDVFGSSGKG